MINLTNTWSTLAVRGLGIGDTTIKNVADYYFKTNTVNVEILTGDQQLKSYQPAVSAPDPRRKR